MTDAGHADRVLGERGERTSPDSVRSVVPAPRRGARCCRAARGTARADAAISATVACGFAVGFQKAFAQVDQMALGLQLARRGAGRLARSARRRTDRCRRRWSWLARCRRTRAGRRRACASNSFAREDQRDRERRRRQSVTTARRRQVGERELVHERERVRPRDRAGSPYATTRAAGRTRGRSAPAPRALRSARIGDEASIRSLSFCDASQHRHSRGSVTPSYRQSSSHSCSVTQD